MSLFDLPCLDPDEYAEIVAWIREVSDAERRAAHGDDEPDIDMDAPDWRDKVR